MTFFITISWPYFFFRLNGYGLHFMWRLDSWKPLFSERIGKETSWKLGRVHVKVLKP